MNIKMSLLFHCAMVILTIASVEARFVSQPEMKIRALWEKHSPLAGEDAGYKALAEVSIQFSAKEGNAYDSGVMSIPGNASDVPVVPPAPVSAATNSTPESVTSASTQTPKVESGTQTMDCGEGYTRNSITNKCYKIYEIDMNWVDSAAKCLKEDAHLLIINNMLEAAVISNMITNKGFADSKWRLGEYLFDSRWISVLDEPIDDLFHVWASNKDSSPSNDCLYYISDNLNNYPCEITTPFICEKYI